MNGMVVRGVFGLPPAERECRIRQKVRLRSEGSGARPAAPGIRYPSPAR